MPIEAKLLLADGDASIRDVMRRTLTDQGYLCDTALDGLSAIKMMAAKRYDLFLIEAELPGIDGLSLCRHLRRGSSAPVIFLSRMGHEEDRLAGFSAGGTDYVIKPFYPRELVARIRSLLHLCGFGTGITLSLELGSLRIEADSRGVYLGNERLQLTPKEYDLMLFFTRHPRQAFSRAKLLEFVWGEAFSGSDRTVDTHVKSLRSKLRPYQNCIETVWGFGYRFDPLVLEAGTH